MAEEQVRQQQTQLAHLSRINTAAQMALGLAHELNQPLSAIANCAASALRAIESDRAQWNTVYHCSEADSTRITAKWGDHSAPSGTGAWSGASASIS